jgi:hypothetical protein
METAPLAKTSFFSLFRALTGDTRTLVRQEVQLAKTEISEKISRLGWNAVSLAIGGFVAYAGLIAFLLGLGWLLAWFFAKVGLQPVFAGFLGLATIGLLVMVIGGAMIFKGVKTISRESLAPQRTLQTLQELKGSPPSSAPSEEPSQRASSAELQNRVEATEQHLGETLDELGHRFNPQYVNAVVKNRIQSTPYQAGLIALGAGLIGGLWLTRRPHRP